MLQDLDKTLKALLQRELPPAIGVSFVTPDQDFLAKLTQITPPLVNLFLYDLRENRDLRENTWTVASGAPGGPVRIPPPSRLDCSYLITAWTKSDQNEAERGVQEEHQILGQTALVLLRHRHLPEDLLQGALRGQSPSPPCASLGLGPLQSPSELWHAMGGRPRAALHCTVTLSLPSRDAEKLGPPVEEHQLRLHPELSLKLDPRT